MISDEDVNRIADAVVAKLMGEYSITKKNASDEVSPLRRLEIAALARQAINQKKSKSTVRG
jgi:hypothetical protein